MNQLSGAAHRLAHPLVSESGKLLFASRHTNHAGGKPEVAYG
ncbi:hypothetical protein [Novipirellula maiorica]|nr:hypothetical protein [Rhodopirellula maiorica]